MIRVLALTAFLVPAAALAQMTHEQMMHEHQGGGSVPTQPGQGAFAAIHEIVGILEADPKTDWSKVNIDALRQHLIDMNNVTLAAEIEGGASLTVRPPAKDAAKLHGLGFLGVMTRGMHHQEHHLMIARGEHPHN
jgi:hypothetical protein